MNSITNRDVQGDMSRGEQKAAGELPKRLLSGHLSARCGHPQRLRLL
ncbi:hypothetical protein [Sedimenticola hydrogenitrophicus]|nr:hypothetical protein [Sedimenticola hydrogenitrophicus]